MNGLPQPDLGVLIEPIARKLLGEPNARLSKRDELRFGTNGSLVVHVSGNHRGTWRDHEAGIGGGVLDLIEHKSGGNREAAKQWVHENFGDDQPGKGPKRIVATYPYVNAEGQLLFEVVRYDPKDFRQRRPDGKGGHLWNLQGVQPTLYRLPEVLAAIEGNQRIFIVEGEKDVDRLAQLGLVATCNAGGAGKWKPQLSELLHGARAAIIPDADDPGRAHGEDVARQLASIADDVRLIELEGQGRKEDVSDWLDRGGTADELCGLVSAAAVWTPRFKPLHPIIWFGREDEDTPLSWLIRDLMVDGGMSVIYGPPKSSKTFLSLDLALHVAHGRDWYSLGVKPGGVVYVCGEGVAGVRQRMKAWRQENHGSASAPFALIPQSVNLFDGDEELNRLIADIRGLTGPMNGPVKLVVFDTLARMIGSGDEDRAKDINVLVRACERIQRETGAHVMIVHHSGKDRDRGMRGSNALLGAVDVAIEVKRDDAGLCEAKVLAIKDGGEIGPFAYTLRQSVVGMDAEGTDIVSCVIDPAGASQGGKADRITGPEKHALKEFHALAGTLGTFGDMDPNVPLGTWRDRIYSSSEGSHEARKKRASRAINSLEVKNIIKTDGETARLVRQVK